MAIADVAAELPDFGPYGLTADQSKIAPRDRTVTLPYGIPSLTLGWGVIRWISDNLLQHNGPDAGKPFRLTEGQVRFLLHWYAVNDEGQWLYNHGVRRLSKASGKSPMAAVLALAELLGPVRVADFDSRVPGGVVGRPVVMPLVQIAATSEKQTANTMRVIQVMASKTSPLARRYGLDVGKTYIDTPGGGRLEQITSSASAAEGAEVTYAVADEALSLDTPVPTPDGWTTVGDIEPGDTIYGSTGPVRVTYTTPVFEGRPCYKVTFSDGTSLVADEGHLWETKLVGSNALPRVRRTREMVEDGRKFSVPRPAPFDAEEVDMPVDPYVLGAWLGDGASRWAALACGDEDVDFMLNEVKSRGVPAATARRYGDDEKPTKAWTISLKGNQFGDLYTKDGSSFRGGLVKLGVLGNKHIPEHLLRASRGQRLDLLRGLMDTDGWVHGKSGAAVYAGANKRLVEDVAQLVRTFGWTANITSRTDDRWNKPCTMYRVSFRPDTDHNPFLLPRKASRVRPPSRRKYKTIESIEPVDSVPVKCIEVDSGDHLFVAGEGWTLTHNTEHWLPGNGGPALIQTIVQNAAKTGSRVLETSNAWIPGQGSVAETSFDTWCDQVEGKTRADQITLYDAVVAPPNTVLTDDPEEGEVSLSDALRFVYADTPWVDIEPIRQLIWSPSYEESRARRFYLNQPNAAEEAWVTLQEWSALADPDRKLRTREGDTPGEEIVMFFDGSKSNDHTALVGCALEDGHIFTIGVWEPDPRTGVVSQSAVQAAVEGARRRFQVLAFWADVREWETQTLTDWPELFKDDLIVPAQKGRTPRLIAWDMRTYKYRFAEACEMALAEIQDRAFTHDGDWTTSRHVGNARVREQQGRFAIAKESPKSPAKIDAAICVVGARMLYRVAKASPEYEARHKKKKGRIYSLA